MADQKIRAERKGSTLFVSFPLEWCEDLETTGALFEKAARIASEREGGTSAEH